MKYINYMDILKVVCKAESKWGMFVSLFFPDDDRVAKRYSVVDEVKGAMQCFDINEHVQLIVDGHGYLLFDTEKEMVKAYNGCVGDDGPTELNPYKGPVKVYALTCSPEGEFLSENT